MPEKKRYDADKEKYRESSRRNYWEHLEKRRQYSREYYQKHRKELLVKGKQTEAITHSSRLYYQTNKEAIKMRVTALKNQYKNEVLTHYGNGKLACVRCGFIDIRALTIDHIRGGGTNHRRQLKAWGFSFHRWLRKNNYPKGYQTLCMNCQFIKRYEGEEYGKNNIS